MKSKRLRYLCLQVDQLLTPVSTLKKATFDTVLHLPLYRNFMEPNSLTHQKERPGIRVKVVLVNASQKLLARLELYRLTNKHLLSNPEHHLNLK